MSSTCHGPSNQQLVLIVPIVAHHQHIYYPTYPSYICYSVSTMVNKVQCANCQHVNLLPSTDNRTQNRHIQYDIDLSSDDIRHEIQNYTLQISEISTYS